MWPSEADKHPPGLGVLPLLDILRGSIFSLLPVFAAAGKGGPGVSVSGGGETVGKTVCDEEGNDY